MQNTTIITFRDTQMHSLAYWRIRREAESKYGWSLINKASYLMTEIEEDGPNRYRLIDSDTGRLTKVRIEQEGSSIRCSCGYHNYSTKPCSHIVAVRMLRDFLNEVRKQSDS